VHVAIADGAHAGRLVGVRNLDVLAIADDVIMVAAGLPVDVAAERRLLGRVQLRQRLRSVDARDAARAAAPEDERGRQRDEGR